MVHDLTATIESVVPVTSTRVFVLYKLNTAVGRAWLRAGSGGRRALRRADQPGAAVPVAKSRWEALVAVRNMFHDDFDSGSLYDELLVVRAPTRVLGGVTVKF